MWDSFSSSTPVTPRPGPKGWKWPPTGAAGGVGGPTQQGFDGDGVGEAFGRDAVQIGEQMPASLAGQKAAHLRPPPPDDQLPPDEPLPQLRLLLPELPELVGVEVDDRRDHHDQQREDDIAQRVMGVARQRENSGSHNTPTAGR